MDDKPTNTSNKNEAPPSFEKIVIHISDTFSRPLATIQAKNLEASLRAGGKMLTNRNFQTALKMWTKGIKSAEWYREVGRSLSTLNQKDKDNLLQVGDIIKSLEKAYPKSTSQFSKANPRKGAIVIKETKTEEAVQPGNNIVLEKTGDQIKISEEEQKDYFSKDFQEKSADFLNNFVEDALEKQSDEIIEEYEEEPYNPPQFDLSSVQKSYTPPPELEPGEIESRPPTTNIASNTFKRAGNFISDTTSSARNAITSSAKQLTKKALASVGRAGSSIIGQAGLYAGLASALLIGAIAWLTTVIITIITWSIGTIIFVAVVLLIINSGAYMVPPGEDLTKYGAPGVIPPGGTVGGCGGNEIDITADLASRITHGSVRLLPPDSGARPLNLCFTPLMVILHSSAGYDNDSGNDVVYEVLSPPERQASCNLASDTDDVILMQPFYENVAEMSWCANSWNDMGISIEISGECQDGASQCRRNYSKCQVGDDSYPYIFEEPSNTPTHPCPNENDLTFSAVCEIMKQYNIPWCQVYTHDDVPNQSHTDPVGKGWVYNYFIPRLRDNCDVPANSECR